MDTKDIMLRIIGRQISGEAEVSEDQMEFVTEGKFYEDDDSIYLVYDESEFSGMEGCTTSLKITGNKVNMRRFGEDMHFDTEMKFEQGKRFKSLYDTPYGAVEMEILTNSINNQIEKKEVKGTINIDYHISLKGLSEGRSILDIEIMN
ncbi:MAG: DUF1934 domain-containing protein [Anaerovorax sp.]